MTDALQKARMTLLEELWKSHPSALTRNAHILVSAMLKIAEATDVREQLLLEIDEAIRLHEEYNND